MNKVAVYAICKNEEKNIIEWLKSIEGADYIIVGDTGSTDSSKKILEENNVIVHDIVINPWRFDYARNEIIKKIPLDVKWCISLDLDERLDKNFIDIIKKEETNKHNIIISDIIELDYNKNIITKFNVGRVHVRENCMWKNPVHEKLYILDNIEKKVHNKNLKIYHMPDDKKNRTDYLRLIKLAHTENKDNFLFHYQLGREYIKNGFLNEGLETFLKINKKNLNEYEKSTVNRMIARTYYLLKNFKKANTILMKNIKKYPQCSSNYVELVSILYEQKRYDKIIEIESTIKNINDSYESMYNDYLYKKWMLYDILSIVFFNKKDYKKACVYGEKAYLLNKSDIRIKNNFLYYKKFMEE